METTDCSSKSQGSTEWQDALDEICVQFEEMDEAIIQKAMSMTKLIELYETEALSQTNHLRAKYNKDAECKSSRLRLHRQSLASWFAPVSCKQPIFRKLAHLHDLKQSKSQHAELKESHRIVKICLSIPDEIKAFQDAGSSNIPFVYMGWPNIPRPNEFLVTPEVLDIYIPNAYPQTLFDPRDIASNHTTGDIYLVDSGNVRVIVFSDNLDYKTSLGMRQEHPYRFDFPVSICVSVDGRQLAVGDFRADAIHIFSVDLVPIRSISCNVYDLPLSYGPRQACYDIKGDLYVAHEGTENVFKFDANGKFKLDYKKLCPQKVREGPLSVITTNDGEVLILGGKKESPLAFTLEGSIVKKSKKRDEGPFSKTCHGYDGGYIGVDSSKGSLSIFDENFKGGIQRTAEYLVGACVTVNGQLLAVAKHTIVRFTKKMSQV
eukprot:TRINITY_DN3243_c0_g1_i1.p1 TRINITY_DN3243_c0_g1~~TRINITY_DN3243_c0_g1_i1.p1  ORF type:complete len:433 (-),score=73.78 TRINITY_DN3243_c0_g1_i1:67-1365(-)